MIDKMLKVVIWIIEITPSLYKNRLRKKILLRLLQDNKYKWRKLKILTERTGTTEQECRGLLIEIKARGSKNEQSGEEIWGLIERVGV